MICLNKYVKIWASSYYLLSSVKLNFDFLSPRDIWVNWSKYHVIHLFVSVNINNMQFHEPKNYNFISEQFESAVFALFNCVPPWWSWSWSRGDIQTILNVSSHVIFKFQVLIYYSMMFILIPRSFLCIFFYQKKENKKYASRGDRCQDTASPNWASKCLGAWRVCFLITIIIYL